MWALPISLRSIRLARRCYGLRPYTAPLLWLTGHLIAANIRVNVMKPIYFYLISIGFMLLAGCDQKAGHVIPLYEVVPPAIVDDPIIEDPIIDDPIIDDPIEDPIIDDPIEDPIIDDPIEDPIIDDPIEDPIIDEPDIPEYVEITEEQCNSKTDDERCEGETMIYCGGAGIEYLIRVECDKIGIGNRRCITFNDDKRVVATCTSQMTEDSSCTAANDGEMQYHCSYLDFDYTGREYYYNHYTRICSIGSDGIYRWHILDFDLCSDSCSPGTGCSLKPCSTLGTTLCSEDQHLLICTQFKDGYYYVNNSASCDN